MWIKTTCQGLFLLAVSLTLAASATAQPAAPSEEAASVAAAKATPKVTGGVYVEAVGTVFQDRQKMASTLDELRALPFDEVLIRVRKNGFAYYNSQLVPKPISVSGNFDPLAATLSALQDAPRPKKVLAWFSPWAVGNGGHTLTFATGHVMAGDLIKGKADAVMTSPDGGLYLNPAFPDIQAHLEAVVADLAGRYAIDGIVFDLEIPATVSDPTPWQRFDWTTMASSLKGMALAARKARPGLIIGVADQGSGSVTGDQGIDVRDRWLSGEWVDRLYCNSFVDEKSAPERFDSAVNTAVWQANAAKIPVIIGVAGNRNVAIDALAQCKRAIALGASGIAVCEFSRPTLDEGARKLFLNALSSAVLSDGGPRVSQRVDRSQFDEAVATLAPPATDETMPGEADTTGAVVLTANGETDETVFELPPPPDAIGPAMDEGLPLPAIEDETSGESLSGDDELDRALSRLTGIKTLSDDAPTTGATADFKSSRVVFRELLRDPLFTREREWKVIAPEVQAREQLKAIFPNIF